MIRRARKPVTLPLDGKKEKVTFPRGSVVMISPYLTHNEEAHYERADTWDPQRWIENPRLASQMNSGGEVRFMQFGWASHRCPGEKVAKMSKCPKSSSCIPFMLLLDADFFPRRLRLLLVTVAAITILTILDRVELSWSPNPEVKDPSEFDKLENLDFSKIGSAWSKKPVEIFFEPRADHTPTFVGAS